MRGVGADKVELGSLIGCRRGTGLRGKGVTGYEMRRAMEHEAVYRGASFLKTQAMAMRSRRQFGCFNALRGKPAAAAFHATYACANCKRKSYDLYRRLREGRLRSQPRGCIHHAPVAQRLGENSAADQHVTQV